ncbi:MAG: hypothetical protein KatS3mg110_3166 [Pirellulaceae bacterium]|nr:MAG: hypothetical protein KatS3mg110_3166 [Pirellulaceae bacterium]
MNDSGNRPDCDRFQENLSAFFSGTISSEEVIRFLAHAQACPVCARAAADTAWDQMIQIWSAELPRGLADHAEPVAFWELNRSAPYAPDAEDQTKSMAPTGDPSHLPEVTWEKVQEASNRTSESSEPSIEPNIPDESLPLRARFLFLRELGAGANSLVYLAFDKRLRRLVAVKILRGQWQASDRRCQRALTEAHVAARLSHPHVVTVFDAGIAGATFFLVQQFVPGVSLRTWLQQTSQRFSPRHTACLIARLADAVEHAHGMGIIHRDISPRNILLDTTRLCGELSFTPYLADFGLACFLDADSDLTADGEVIGTPLYMAPEQAEGRIHDVGPASDIYALGAVMFELLAGIPPIRGGNTLDTLRRVVVEDAPDIRRLRRDVPRDLAAICCKCLSKDPTDRYPSAAELRQDLESFLAGLPVQARPAAFHERIQRVVRNYPLPSLLAGALAVAILLFVAALVHSNRELDSLNEKLLTSLLERERAEHTATVEAARARQTAFQQRVSLYAADLDLAARAWQDGDVRRFARLVRAHRPSSSAQHEPTLPQGIEWRFLSRRLVQPQSFTTVSDALYTVAYLPPTHQWAVAGKESVVYIYHADSLTLAGKVDTEQIEINGISVRTDHQQFATAGDDGSVKLWSLPECRLTEQIRPYLNTSTKIFRADYSPQGNYLAICGTSSEVVVCEAETGEVVKRLAWHEGTIESLAWSANGRQLASAGADGRVIVGDPFSGKLHEQFSMTANVMAVGFSPDGHYLAAGDVEGDLVVWDIDTGIRVLDTQLLDGVQSLAFSTGGNLLATADRAGVIRLWNLDVIPLGAVRPQSQWAGHSGRVYSAAFSPEGETLATVCSTGALCTWKVAETPHIYSWPFSESRDSDHEQYVSDVAVMPDGHRIVMAHRKTLSVWDLASHRRERQWQGGTPSQWRTVAVLSDDRFAAQNMHGQLALWSLDDVQPPSVMESPLPFVPSSLFPAGNGADLLSWVPLAPREELWQWRTTSDRWEPVDTVLPTCDAVAVNPINGNLAVSVEGDLRLLDSQHRLRIRRAPLGKEAVRSLTFSSDGRWLASGSTDRHIRVWSADDLRLVKTLEGSPAVPTALAFDSQGICLMSGGADGQVVLWYLPANRLLFTLLEGPESIDKIVLVGPDDYLLVLDSGGRLFVLPAGAPAPG